MSPPARWSYTTSATAQSRMTISSASALSLLAFCASALARA